VALEPVPPGCVRPPRDDRKCLALRLECDFAIPSGHRSSLAHVSLSREAHLVRQPPISVNLTRRNGESRVAHYGRAKTSARLVGTPFGYASRRAWFEPYVARRLE
jgi:hypothetical protein